MAKSHCIRNDKKIIIQLTNDYKWSNYNSVTSYNHLLAE